jgi:DNA-binding XRE family transcriptional regulator
VGVHYQTIGYIERGEYSPSLVLALKITEELKVSIEHLFWLEKEKVYE